jgi:hypothetical protein
MVRVCLFLSISFLGTVLMSHAAESQPFCTFHSEEREEAEKWAKQGIKIDRKVPGMKSICHFHEDHAKDTPITPIVYPDSAWHETNKETEIVDRVDGRIADNKPIPYTYKQIKKQPNVNAYVLKAYYELVRDDALIYLGEREKFFSTQLHEGEKLRSSQRKDFKLTLERIQEYVTILKTSTPYRHECIGLIVPKRAVMVALQWAHFADDHTDKGKEELKKTLVGDDLLTELCLEMDELFVGDGPLAELCSELDNMVFEKTKETKITPRDQYGVTIAQGM